MSTELLSASGLAVEFPGTGGHTRHVTTEIDFRVAQGEIVGIVGESGSGKTVTARAIAGLLPPEAIVRGSIRLHGSEVPSGRGKAARAARKGVAYIFQNPTKALDPVFTVGSQLRETLRTQQGLRGPAAEKLAIELLSAVGIPEPQRRLNEYPHSFSGGMAQRVMVALALACNPRLLIADEPTSALDVSIQSQILDLLREIRESEGTGIVFISHSLGAVAELCDRVIVMYAGRVVEIGPTDEVVQRPRHPYTVGLLASVPQLRSAPIGEDELPFQEIPAGEAPADPRMLGCNFAQRCAFATTECHTRDTPLDEVEPGRFTRCIRARELAMGER